jgi:hypothetical protein
MGTLMAGELWVERLRLSGISVPVIVARELGISRQAIMRLRDDAAQNNRAPQTKLKVHRPQFRYNSARQCERYKHHGECGNVRQER